MARRTLIEIVGSAASFVNSLKTSAAAVHGFEADLRVLNVDVQASAAAQVKASLRKTARLRDEALAYRQLSSQAARGSAEQITAANLAARAESRLAGSYGVTAAESARLRAHTSGLERDVSRASRGALAGSGIFRGLGRSIAFASGGFLAFASASQFFRTSIDAATQAAATQRQLAAQFKASGKSLGDYQSEIDKTTLKLSGLSGFTKDDLDKSFTTLFRNTGNVAKSLQLTGLAADVARGRNMDLAASTILVGKVAGGNVSILHRYGLQISKNATAQQALTLLTQKYAGQAAAGATAGQKFGAVLRDSEVIIGAGILPTLNKYLAEGAQWLSQMNESGRLQKDVASAADKVRQAVGAGVAVFHAAAGAIKAVDKITGSFKNTLELLLAVKIGSTIGAWVGEMSTLGAAVGEAGAAGKVGLLTSKLTALKLIGPIAIGITVTELFKQIKSGKAQTLLGGGGTKGESLTNFLFSGDPLGRAAAGLFGLKVGDATPYGPTGGLPPAGKLVGSPGMSLDEILAGKSSSPGKTAAASAGRRRRLSPQGQFNLAELRLADAERLNNTKLQRQILQSEEGIVLKLRDQSKTLKDRTQFAQQAAQIEDQIRSLDKAGVTAASKEAAKRKKQQQADAKAALGGVPLPLQLAQAKADALAAATGSNTLTKGQIAAATAIRKAEYKAIRSHKLSMQGLIDAWNEIGQINNQLATSTKGLTGSYRAVSSVQFTAGLGLVGNARKLAEERYAQTMAHRGYTPTGPAVQGQIVHVGEVHVHGVQNVEKLWSELQQVGRTRGQRRGAR